MLTTAQVADELHRPHSTVRNVAAAHGIGTLVNQRLRTFTRADVARLKRVFDGRKMGRPKST